MFSVKTMPVLGLAAISLVSGCGSSETALINSRQAPVEMVSMTGPMSSKFRNEIVTVVHFGFDSDELDAAALRIIEAQAAWILDNPNIRFSVTGHTDRVGNDAYNMDLGMRRADRVVAALVAMGVNEQQLLAQISMGEEENIIETEDRERVNRRVLTEVMGLMPDFHPASILGNEDVTISNSDRPRRNPIDEATDANNPVGSSPVDEASTSGTSTSGTSTSGTPVRANPGNHKAVGGPGENPTGNDGWGEGNRGRSG